MEELYASMFTPIWTGACTDRHRERPVAAKYEPVASMVVTDGEMKGLLVITLMILAAATALAYGHGDVSAAMAASSWPGEPATLLVSGSALLGAAGALRRYAF